MVVSRQVLAGNDQHSWAFARTLKHAEIPHLAVDMCSVLQRVERSSAFVQRRVRLPESADMSKIKAQYINGTLTLEIPKAEVCSQLISR